MQDVCVCIGFWLVKTWLLSLTDRRKVLIHPQLALIHYWGIHQHLSRCKRKLWSWEQPEAWTTNRRFLCHSWVSIAGKYVIFNNLINKQSISRLENNLHDLLLDPPNWKRILERWLRRKSLLLTLLQQTLQFKEKNISNNNFIKYLINFDNFFQK